MSKIITQKCKVENCESQLSKDRNGRPYLKRGYCQKHYLRLYKYGDININKSQKSATKRECIECNGCYKIPLGVSAKHGYAIIDKEFRYLDKYKWSIDTDGYAIATIRSSRCTTKKVAKMHRIIAGTPIGMCTDHINRDKLDNRKNNLRICTPSQNNANKIHFNVKTGLKGVYMCNGKYIASLIYNGEKVVIGIYDNKVDAGIAYDNKIIELFGSFSITNKIMGLL